MNPAMTNPRGTGAESADWSRHPDGLGETSVVPALLDELERGPKKGRAQAIAVELGEERLVHQDSVAPAASPAVPRLVALLSTPEPAQKEDVLLVLARIAAGGGPEPHWHGRPEGSDCEDHRPGDVTIAEVSSHNREKWSLPSTTRRTSSSTRSSSSTRTAKSSLRS